MNKKPTNLIVNSCQTQTSRMWKQQNIADKYLAFLMDFVPQISMSASK